MQFSSKACLLCSTYVNRCFISSIHFQELLHSNAELSGAPVFFLLSGFQPWSGSIPLCACPPSMLTNRQQGSCFASSIKDLLPPVSLNAVEGQPGLTEHHVPSPVHDSLAFIFCKPSSLGELLSYVFSFYC